MKPGWAGLLVGCLLAAGAGADPASPVWQEQATDHFIICHTGLPAAQVSAAGMAAETWYRRLLGELGFPKRGDFWTWDRRIRILLYPDDTAFRAATSAPDWAVGRASMARREIAAWTGEDTWTNSILPHELTHLVFRDYVGVDRTVPLWLVEGVTQWAEPARREAAMEQGRLLVERGKAVPLETLNRWTVADVQAGERAGPFYVQSLSLVAFLFRHGGSESFGTLCRHLKDGKAVEDALRFTYPRTIRTLQDLDRLWRDALSVRATGGG